MPAPWLAKRPGPPRTAAAPASLLRSSAGRAWPALIRWLLVSPRRQSGYGRSCGWVEEVDGVSLTLPPASRRSGRGAPHPCRHSWSWSSPRRATRRSGPAPSPSTAAAPRARRRSRPASPHWHPRPRSSTPTTWPGTSRCSARGTSGRRRAAPPARGGGPWPTGRRSGNAAGGTGSSPSPRAWTSSSSRGPAPASESTQTAFAGARGQAVQASRAASPAPITTVTRSTVPTCAAPLSPNASARAVATTS
jgi:hypothetical protein